MSLRPAVALRAAHRLLQPIKAATNTAMFEKMNDNMDLNAGTIISGDETVDEVVVRIFQEMLEVASGKLTKAEALGFNDFAIKRIGPTM